MQRLYDLQADANSNLIRQAYQFFNGNSLSQLSEQIKEQATALVDAAKAVEGLEEQAAANKKKADDDADKEARQRADDRYAQEEQANEEARQRRTQQALDDANALADATLSEEEKIARKRFDNIERAKRLLTQAVTEQDRFAAESLIKAANLNARFELKKLEDEREKKRLETEKKAADKYADTLEDRLRKFYDEINRANREFGTTLGDRLNGTLEAIRQDINRIRLTIPQNGGGGYPPGGTY